MNSSNLIISGLPTPQLRSGQQGITLIDALIALVIFSVGLLALAALQTVSKQSNYEAMQRTNAAMFAYDLIERMRMNSGALLDYGGDSILSDTHTACTTCDTASAIASNDLFEWKATVLGEKEKNSATNVSVGGLIDPVACLTRVGTTNEFTLTIAWRGQTKVANQSVNSCGTGNYNDPEDPTPSGVNGYRRILELNAFIGN